MDTQFLIPIGIILVGGSAIFWVQRVLEKTGKTEYQSYRWLFPWFFGTIVAGGYLGWFYTSSIVFIILGGFIGLVFGLFGIITDPKTEKEADNYLTTLLMLSFSIGAIWGAQIGKF